MLVLRARSVAETHAIAAALADLAEEGDVLVLAGEMGSGKTAFAQGFGRALAVGEPITSPTFTLVHSYDSGRLVLHHADLYRLDRMAEVAELALGELVEGDGVLLVEWGDVAAGALGDHIEVRLVAPDADEPELREVVLSAVGPAFASRWHLVEAAVGPWLASGDAPC